MSKGAKEIVLLLLHYSPDFTRPTAVQLQKAITYALREGHAHILLPLLDTRISLNFQFLDCRATSAYTPLLWAIEEGDIQLLNLLLEGDNADPNYCTGDEDQIPLLKAALKNHERMARILVSRTSRLHRTRALALSMDHGDGQIAQVLLENGTLPDFKDGDHTASIEEFDCNLGRVHDPLIPPIIRAVCRGHTNLVKLLVTYGANVDVEYRGWIKELSEWIIGGPLLLTIQLGDQETTDFQRGQGARKGVSKGLCAQFENWSYNRPSD